MAANEFLTTEFTQSIQKVVTQVVNDPKTYRGAELLPSVVLPVSKVFTEVIEATGGLTNEHMVGTAPKYVQSFGTKVQEYDPPFYKEGIHYDEKKLLFLRRMGSNEVNVRDVQMYISKDVDRLNRRIEARIELQRWRSLMDGGFTFMGKTISFGIPSNLRVTPSTLWSLDGVTANNSANPINDLRNWVLGGYGPFRKYLFKKIWMNPNTVRFILDNTNTRTYLTSYGASPALLSYDINKVMNVLVPGLPEIETYNGWYQEETVDANNKISVSDAIFFLQDGEILFEVGNLPGGDKYGEFMQTLNLASGTIDSPGAGKFLVVEDCTVPGSKGGISNPFVDIFGGVYGGVKLDRPFDVCTAKVIA